MIVSLIAAIGAHDRGIGFQGKLPWRLPADLTRFRALTMGHSLIMGRRTFESLAGRQLPGRRLILLSRTGRGRQADEGVVWVDSIPSALRVAREGYQDAQAFIAGGAQVYARALQMGVVDRMYLTVVHAEAEADVFFPPFDEAEWTESQAEHREADSKNPYPLTFRTLDARR